MFAPFMPFATEEIYKNVFENNANVEDAKAKSIHLSAWPVGNEFDEEKFKKADDAVKLILFIRKWKHDNAMALNAELQEIVVNVDLGEAADDVKGAMNIKKVTKGEGSLAVPETEIKVDIKK